MKKNVEETIKLIKDDIVKVTEPDFEEVAKVIRAIKGEERSMKQFAKDTGISAPTLSRIINGKVTKPMSIESMLLIAINAHDESKSQELFYELARANGYMSRGEQEKVKAKFKLKKAMQSLYSIREDTMSMVIKGALFERGASLGSQILENRKGKLPTELGYSVKYDFDLDITGDIGEYRWVFFCIPHRCNDWENIKGPDIKELNNQLMRQVSPIFVTDSWNPEKYKDYKVSFCFIDELLYDSFSKATGNAKFNNRFSIILLDDDKGRFVKEMKYEAANYKEEMSPLDLPTISGRAFPGAGIAEEMMAEEINFIEETDAGEGK